MVKSIIDYFKYAYIGYMFFYKEKKKQQNLVKTYNKLWKSNDILLNLFHSNTLSYESEVKDEIEKCIDKIQDTIVLVKRDITKDI